MGKKAKKNQDAPILIPDDTVKRVEKYKGVPVKPPKGELTSEDWCIPPSFHSMPEFKQTVQFFQQCATVRYVEKDGLKVPTQQRDIDRDMKQALETPRKPPPTFKEVKALWTYLKGFHKKAVAKTTKFVNQLKKKEGKEDKRKKLRAQIDECELSMNEELKRSRKFADRQELFKKEYMLGSKLCNEQLGEKAPRMKALVVIECSDAMTPFVDEASDEINKFLNLIVQPNTATLQLATFNGTKTVSMWMQTFQNVEDPNPKKGLPDAQKWLKKNFSKKTCEPQRFPPDYVALLEEFTKEGVQLPWRIYLCCSRKPEDKSQMVLDKIKDLRETLDPPAKGEQVLPISIVAFDPQIVGNVDEKAFFDELAGPNGSFRVDTSQDDLSALDKMLKAVQAKKKQLDKFNKKLDKMVDLSDDVASDRELLQMQIALETMLENDKLVIEWALANDTPPAAPEI